MGKCQHRSINSLHRPITSFFTLSREILKHFRTYGPNLAFHSIALSSVGGVHPTRCQSGMQPGEIWWWSEREVARDVVRVYGRMNMLYGIQQYTGYPTQYIHHHSIGEHSGVEAGLEGRRWSWKKRVGGGLRCNQKKRARKLMGENFRLKWRAEWDKRREMATGQFIEGRRLIWWTRSLGEVGRKEIGWMVTGQSVGWGSS